ncbi:MAG: DUF599 domain-containing protein [Cellvibrionaceae bacterium]
MTIAKELTTFLIEDAGWINLGCLIWFLVCWVGYSRFARHMAKQTECIASVMHRLRLDWMQQLLFRDQRVSDASIIANLERNVSFMASTSILVLAGLLTVLASVSEISQMLIQMPFVADATSGQLQFKLLVLICIFVYAFFTFTWSLRQFGFCSVIVGATPYHQVRELSAEQQQAYARHSGKVLDQAAHSYNFGLRAYYFAMAILAWFVHPLLFVLSVALVVSILYRREFHSSTLQALLMVDQGWESSNSKCQSVDD